MAYEQEEHQAIAAVMLAARLCEQVRSSQTVATLNKADQSPVTIADFAAQAVICQAIAQAFPQDAIVAEENADLLRQPTRVATLEQITTNVQALIPTATAAEVMAWIDHGQAEVCERFWTLDPIDGTKGFLRGDQYAIALALIEAGEVKVGVLACPAFLSPLHPNQGAVFAAVRGQGCRLLSLDGKQSQVVRVIEDAASSDYRFAESVEAGHGNPDWQRAIARTVGLTGPSLAMDSQAKYGAIAAGQAVLYMRLPWVEKPDYQENIWDHAAGAIVVEEAGGNVTDMTGQPLNFMTGRQLTQNRGIVASNGVLHAAVLSALRQKHSS